MIREISKIIIASISILYSSLTCFSQSIDIQRVKSMDNQVLIDFSTELMINDSTSIHWDQKGYGESDFVIDRIEKNSSQWTYFLSNSVGKGTLIKYVSDENLLFEWITNEGVERRLILETAVN